MPCSRVSQKSVPARSPRPDIETVVDLLTRGFEVRSRHYWQRALIWRSNPHPTPAGCSEIRSPLESDGTTVGVILQIFSAIPTATGWRTRCNLSSWYVDPKFRSYASMLVSQAIKYQNVTYMNISPATHTRPIVESSGVFALQRRASSLAFLH